MLKILDPNLVRHEARLDADGSPYKLTFDHYEIVSYRMDSTVSPLPALQVTLCLCTAQGERAQLYSQHLISGSELAELMTPRPGQEGRRKGDFRPSDMESLLVRQGGFEDWINPSRNKVEIAAEIVQSDAQYEKIIERLEAAPPPPAPDIPGEISNVEDVSESNLRAVGRLRRGGVTGDEGDGSS
jgi:hypothetical protein